MLNFPMAGVLAPSLASLEEPKRKSWQAGLFDRLMPDDLGLSEDERDKLGR